MASVGGSIKHKRLSVSPARIKSKARSLYHFWPRSRRVFYEYQADHMEWQEKAVRHRELNAGSTGTGQCLSFCVQWGWPRCNDDRIMLGSCRWRKHLKRALLIGSFGLAKQRQSYYLMSCILDKRSRKPQTISRYLSNTAPCIL